MLRGDIMIRPELRTAGGEVCDILYHGKYVGHITLVYREKELLSGSVQLDERQLRSDGKDRVMEAVNDYVQSLIHALQVPECDVRVTCSTFEYVISTEHNVGTIREFVDSPQREAGRSTDERIAEDDDILEKYELVIVGEEDNLIHYQVYRESDQNLVAEAFIAFEGAAVTGEMVWMENPAEDELDAVTELLISDFDDDEIDEISIDMKHNGETFESVELIHSDIADGWEEEEPLEAAEEDYSAVLVRDEGDVLIYDIYCQVKGGLPIARATIDISRLKISGIIEFERETDESVRETVAETLMDEMEKEINFETFHVTMLYNRVPIDNILFENEAIQGQL